jgi:hypothetical protein
VNYPLWISSENSQQIILLSSFVTFIASSGFITEKYQIYGQISRFCMITIAFWCTNYSKTVLARNIYSIGTSTSLTWFGPVRLFLCLQNWKSCKGVIWNNLKAFRQCDESSEWTFEEWFQQCFGTWQKHWNLCIKLESESFEDDDIQ